MIFVPKAKITDEGLALQILLNSAVVDQDQHSTLQELIFPMSKDPETLKPGLGNGQG